MIFVRFSKRCSDVSKDANKSKSYRRAVRVGNSCLVQDGDKIVAYSFLNEDNIYDIIIQACDKQAEYERYIKRFIGNSAKWLNLKEKKRRYKVAFIADVCKMNFDITLKGVLL